jgi:eukaryotic-like serine/threonine-protein kinase
MEPVIEPASQPNAREVCTSNSRWDVYVAPEGAPISLWFHRGHPMPWPVCREVIRQAIDEIQADEMANHLSSLPIDRWWLTSSGKLTLSEAWVETPTTTKQIDRATNTMFASIATLALPSRGDAGAVALSGSEETTPFSAHMVPPWRATQLLQHLKSGRVDSPRVIHDTLETLSQRPQSVTVTMRLVHAAIYTFLLGSPGLVIFGILIAPVMQSVVEMQMDSQRLTTLAAIFKSPEQHPKLLEQIDAPKLAEYLNPERIAQIDRIADAQVQRFGNAFENLGYLERLAIEQQGRIRGMPDPHSKPSPDFSRIKLGDESSTASQSGDNDSPSIRFGKIDDEQIRVPDEPESIQSVIARFEKLETMERTRQAKPWLNRTARGYLTAGIGIPFGILVLWETIWRGGVCHMLTGLAVVRRDGRRAAYWRCAVRSLLFWLPFMAIAAVMISLDTQSPEWLWWTHQLRRLYVALPLIYLIAAIRWPTRGPHDIAAGTYLVPR